MNPMTRFFAQLVEPHPSAFQQLKRWKREKATLGGIADPIACGPTWCVHQIRASASVPLKKCKYHRHWIGRRVRAEPPRRWLLSEVESNMLETRSKRVDPMRQLDAEFYSASTIMPFETTRTQEDRMRRPEALVGIAHARDLVSEQKDQPRWRNAQTISKTGSKSALSAGAIIQHCPMPHVARGLTHITRKRRCLLRESPKVAPQNSRKTQRPRLSPS
jgi:hypothetical protein